MTRPPSIGAIGSIGLSAAIGVLVTFVACKSTPPSPVEPGVVVIPSAHPSPDPPPNNPLPPPGTENTTAPSSRDSGLADPSPKKPEEVVAALRPAFKSCYQTGLRTNPKMTGRVTFTTRITPIGTVDTITPGTTTGLSPAVVACMTDVLRGASFPAVAGGTTINVPIVFKLKDAKPAP